MSISWTILLAYGIIRLVLWVLKDTGSKVADTPPVYTSKVTLIKDAYCKIGLVPRQKISPGVIEHALNKKLEYAQNEALIGSEVSTSDEAAISATKVLFDYMSYAGFLN